MKKIIFKPAIIIWHWFKLLSFKKKVFLILILTGLLIFAYRQYQTDPTTSQYELAPAEFGSLTEIVSETGHVTTAGAAPVYSTTTGLVSAVYVDNHQQVAKNTPLFKVTSTATKQEKDAALANYLAAKNAHETALANQHSLQAVLFAQWDRFKELAEGDEYQDADGNPRHNERNLPEFLVPEKEWLAAEANYKKQQTAVSQASANLSAAWQAYQATQDSQVHALLDGQVVNLSITTGDSVIASSPSNLTSVPPALVLLQPDITTTIKIEVSETDVVKISANQPTTVEFDALPHQTFAGVVDRVDTLTAPTQGAVNYSVYVKLTDTSELIRGGMTADVDITVSQKDNVLLVPTSAVKPYEGGRAVRIVDSKGQIEFVPVQIGSRGNGSTEIISGIEPDTQVIVALSNDQVDRKSMGFF